MSRKLSEVTSALFDSQDVDAKELDDVLNDEQSAQTWHRYSVARAALKNELDSSVELDISQHVVQLLKTKVRMLLNPVLVNRKVRVKQHQNGSSVSKSSCCS